MKLHQVIAIEDSTKRDGDLTPLYHALQKPGQFNGFARTYQPLQEEGTKYPDESNRVQANAKLLIKNALDGLVRWINTTGTKDKTNCRAMADIVVDGQVLAQNVPATHILFLEKRVVDLRTLVGKIPVLDASKDWEYDPNKGCYKTQPEKVIKTIKRHKSIVKIEPGPHSPGQAELVMVDEPEGTWSRVDLSTALPADTIKKLLDNLSKLEIALKSAREQANGVDADVASHGQKILDYVFSCL